jgi:hypothetical protein
MIPGLIPVISRRGKLWLLAGVVSLVVLAGIAKWARDRGMNDVLVQQNTAKADSLKHELVPLKKSRKKAREAFGTADSAYHAHPDSTTAATTIGHAETTIATSDTVLAKQDTLIQKQQKLLELKNPRPNRVTPYAMAERDDSAHWAGRVGVDLRFGKVRLGPAVERRGTSTRFVVVGRVDFR